VRYSEVEGYLNACAGIAEASVTSVVSAHGTRVLVGHMIRDEGAQITASHVKEILQAQCPAYMVPSYLMFHEELPRTDTGKVLRRALPDPFADSAQQAAARAPLSGLQAEVAQVWSSVLGRSDFAPDDDFFDVGGDSLQAMSMVLRLERAHQVRLGYESLVIKGAQLGHLAARIAEAKAGPSDERLLPLSEGQDSDLAPLFILPVENGEFSNWLYLVNAAKHQRPIWGAHVRDPSARSAFGRSSAQDLAAFAARSVQAHETRRPVFLAGYSAGTFQAIEVLRHLEAAGTPVAGLILIDPPLRSQDPDRKAWRWRRVASALVKQRNPALALERAGFVFAGTRTRELELADEDVFWTYQATPLSTDVPVFLGLAEDGNPGRPEQEATWRAVLGAAIDVHSLQGYHNTVLRDPHASGLAAILHDWMTRAEAKVKAPVAD